MQFYANIRVTVAISLLIIVFIPNVGLAQWKFSWDNRTDRDGKPAGIYAITPIPIDENSTSYSITNDEGTKTFYLGTKYYVDGKDGSDSNDGLSFVTPKKTITAALVAADSGNKTIIVRGAHDGWDGIYYETNIRIRIGVDDSHRFIVVGYGQERPILDAGGAHVNIFRSSGATPPSSAYFTLQRLKLQNTSNHGMQIGTLNTNSPFTERKRDKYVNLIDMEGYRCGFDPAIGSSGAFYFMNADNAWIYHCTSGHTFAHAFKIGDGARNSLNEWSVAYEFGYYTGVTLGSYGHPSGFDYPDTGTNHELRYGIAHTGLFYAIQIRGNINADPNGIGLVKIHHCEIYDTTHFDDVIGESGHVSPSQVLLITAYQNRTPSNEIHFYSNIVRDSADSDTRGIYALSNSDNIYIYNNLLYGNSGYEIHVGDSDAKVYLLNNSIYDNDNTNALIFNATGTNLIMKNNILYQAGPNNCFKTYSEMPIHTSNIFYSPSGSVGIILDPSETYADPNWVSLPSGAFQEDYFRIQSSNLHSMV